MLKRLALWVHSGGAKKFDFSNRTDRSYKFPHSPTNLLRRATCRIPPIVGNSTGLLLRPILAEAVLSNSPQGSFEKA